MPASNRNRTPLELLEYQTQLLKGIYDHQQEILQQQRRLDAILTKGIESILLEQGQQSKLLKNVSSAAVLYFVLAVLGLAIWFCVGSGLF